MAQYDWITADSITTDLENGSKEEIIEQLVELLRLTGKVTDPEQVEKDILQRESVASTAIDDTFDAPHALTAGVSDFCISVGIVEHTSLYILIAWNESNTRNLRYLATLLEVVKNEATKQKMLAAETNDAVYRILASALDEAGLA